MKKIYVNKSDSAAAVIEKIINAKESEIVLYLPKGTELASSKNNFNLLKREAQSAGKSVVIESSDTEAREIAESLGLKAVDPLLGRGKKLVSDIVPPTSEGKEAAIEIKRGVSKPLSGGAKPEEAAESLFPPKRKLPGLGLPKPSLSLPTLEISSTKKLLFGALAIVIIASTIYLALFVLPKVNLTLVFQKIPWNFDGSVVVDDKLKETSVSGTEIRIKGESLSEKKNMTASYPASGTKLIEKKATGKLVVYNAYSSSKQSLVKDTRFATPDGKIFRLDKSVTIPGASIENAKIVPSSVEVTVTADKPGIEYNIPPTSRFRIPGFQGTAKYDGFYGESKEAMTGGFVGEVKVPTEDDSAKAKTEVHKSLEDSLTTQIAVSLPKDIKVLPSAREFVISKEDIDEVAGEDGKFKITSYAEVKILGFREEDLLSALGNLAASDTKLDLMRLDYTLDYGEPRVDFSYGRLSAAISFKSNWARKFDVEDFKKSIRGKSELDLKSKILGLPGIRSGEVKLWPFWVRSAPSDLKNIKVDVKYEL